MTLLTEMPTLGPTVEIDDPEIDVEALMQQIRANLLARRAQAEAQGLDFDHLAAGAWLFSDRGRFPDYVYDSLFDVNVNYNKMFVTAQISPSRLPIIGPLIERLKEPFHLLVLHYLHQAVVKQAAFNGSLARILTGVVETLNRPDETPILKRQLAEMECRLKDLEARLAVASLNAAV